MWLKSAGSNTGLFVELMVREILRIENIDEPENDNTHFTRTRLLKNEGLLPYDVNQWINQVRKSRNDSTHEDIATEQETLFYFNRHSFSEGRTRYVVSESAGERILAIETI